MFNATHCKNIIFDINYILIFVSYIAKVTQRKNDQGGLNIIIINRRY